MRQRFMFWLDHDKPQEKDIAQDIQVLKQSGLFARTIRDGIRLVHSLRQGRVDVLMELFPWVEEYFRQPSAPVGIPDNDPLREQINFLTTHLLKQGATPIDLPRKPDPNITIEITQAKRDADNNATFNFMISSALQVYGSYEGLPPEVIAYGVRTGRIQEKTAKSSGPKAMKVPQFASPSFDELEI